MSKKKRNKTRTQNQQQAKRASVALPASFVRAQRFNSARLDSQDLHWRYVDNKSVDLALDPVTRRRQRERARFEVANNSYAYGAGMSIANAVIGDGPKLQVNLDGCGMASKKASKLAERIEGEFSHWAEQVCLGEKLRAMRFARYQDGESFAVLHNNPRIEGSVTLDFKPIDCERVQAKHLYATERSIDGIELDEWGNPISYRVLQHHPGGQPYAYVGYPSYAIDYSADRVVHWFRKTWPEQHRGCSELSPGLDILQYLGRYSRSVVTAAETAANLALVFYTDAIDDVGGYDIDSYSSASMPMNPDCGNDNPFTEMPFSRGTTMTAPMGSKISQLKAEQPTSNYQMLVDELLSEFGAAIGVPRLILKNSAAGYNYASGRLDLQEYWRFIHLNQMSCEEKVLRPIMKAWFQEWGLANGYRDIKPCYKFWWEGHGHVDPHKEATAQQIRLQNNTTTMAIEYGRLGLDWEDQLTQLAREKAKIAELEKEYGVSFSDSVKQPLRSDQPDQEE